MAYEGFQKLEGKLAGKPGVTNPGALAAAIGRRKYTPKVFNKAATTHHSLRKAGAQKALRK